MKPSEASRYPSWKLISSFLFLWWFLIGTAGADSLTPRLFTWATAASDTAELQKLSPRLDSEVTRRQFARLHLDRMADTTAQDGVEQISLNLFEDALLIAVKDRLERRSLTNYTWFGHIAGAPHSQVILTVEQGSMAGNITVQDDGYGVQANYQIRPAPGGFHEIRQIDQSVFEERESGTSQGQSDYVPVFTPTIDLLPGSQADDGSTIDVMVLYTNTAAAATANIAALVQLGVDETNQSYLNSGINQRIRLVHKAQVNYAETGSLCGSSSSDLSRLQGKTDGYLDNIHSWRDTYAADIVSLWVESGDACGCGYFMSNVSLGFAESAFNVVARNCATGYYSFGHEMGHNMGAMHDWYVDKNTAPYAYAHGYVNTANRWRTIMAYNDKCRASGLDCTRIQYWSNPQVSYGGNPTGIAEGQTEAADNRKTLNNTAYTVANFRTGGGTTCNYAISPTSQSFSASGGSGTVNVTADSGCAWTATTSVSWIAVTTGTSGSSNGTVSYTVAANTSTNQRTGTLTIAGKTFTATQAGSSGTLPDLVVTAVTSPSTGVAGGQIQVSETVKNQGGQTAVETGAAFYLSTDSTITVNDIPTYYGCGIASIAPGESQSCGGLIEIPASVPAGSYYLGAYADNANTITESNETNNGLAASNRIVITGSGGQTYTVTLNKTGTGSGTVSGGGNYTSGATVNLTATPASGSTFSGWSPSPCAASFLMPASNLTCTATFNLIPPNQPDLVITTVTSPSTGTAGGTIDVSFGIKNQGGQAAGSFWVGFYLSTNSTITTSDIDTSWGCGFNSLAAGESSSCGGSIGIPASIAAGTYYLGVYADSKSEISEGSESNNGLAASNQITIGSSGGNSATTLITHYYTSILERGPDAGGLAYWQNQIAQRQAQGLDVKPVFRDMAYFFFNSAEYLARNTTNTQYITNLYFTFFQRAPDTGGMSFWLGQLAVGMSRNNAMSGFLYSPEFTAFMQSLGF